MQICAFEDVLCSGYYLTKFDPDAIQQLLEYLTPEKMKASVVSKKFQGKTDKIEKWYGIEYREESLNRETLDSLINCGFNEAFKLPNKNPFIPSDFTLVSHSENPSLSDCPHLIHSTKLARVWFKEDTKFLLPKAYVNFEIRYVAIRCFKISKLLNEI